MKADLHIHTKESDGCLSVEEVLSVASQCGLQILAITDHETTSAAEKAQKSAYSFGVQIIPGVELSTVYQGEEVHLLGYYKDIQNDLLQEKLLKIRREKTAITNLMLQKLNQNGIDLEWEEVIKSASQDGAVCKTHIMYALYNRSPKNGRLDWNEVASWFRPGGLAYVPYLGNPYSEAVDFIFNTGGFPVLAHPGLIRNKALVNDMLSYKPIGLEVYYGYWDRRDEKVACFEEILKKSAVLSTGGSDYHGFFSPAGIGQVFVPGKCVTDLKEYLQID
ncbi:MAG: 5'-3' exoribonuclease [Candidatus Dichloromethanomonas elyunquensis]|nr:MAG: 5'-3' exoribonuclease [Candidatus Dichloromethanomonas elyunquensis]